MNDIQDIKKIIDQEAKTIEALEQSIQDARKRQKTIVRNFNRSYRDQLTPVEKFTDKLANFAGSWTFVIGFLIIMASWMFINVTGILGKPFDPFPFILLNLCLSTIAALQAPVILMSQSRISDRDRERAEHDYEINLQAELEVKALHDKLNFLLTEQWGKLLEIQAKQLAELENIKKSLPKKA